VRDFAESDEAAGLKATKGSWMVLQMIAAGVSAAWADRPVDGAESQMARRHEIAEASSPAANLRSTWRCRINWLPVWRIVADHQRRIR
jgi:hypothetical protein